MIFSYRLTDYNKIGKNSNNVTNDIGKMQIFQWMMSMKISQNT